MKRIVTILLLWILLIPSVGAQNIDTMPTAEELKAVNDSILAEAYQLYLHEKVAWILEDLFYGSESKAIKDVEGWIPFTDDGVNVKGIFFNEEKTKSLFEASFNIETREWATTDSIRNLTVEEIEAINVHLQVINAVNSLDNIPSCPEGCTFNIQVMRMGEDLYRVYWILGTSQHGIIPFGCDFSYDCDSSGNITEFRRYHNSYIPSPLIMDGEPVREIRHSHTSICPYVAPTDIALFLLYGYGSSELTGFKVYSSALKCYFVFDAESFEISVENR